MNTIILQAASGGNGYGQLIFFAVAIFLMYVVIIRQPLKKQKRENNFRSELKKGDQVITVGGIYGKITEVKESSVILENYGVKMKVEKSAIAMNAISE